MGRVGQGVLDIDTLDGTAHLMDMTWEDGVSSLVHETDALYSVECDPGLVSDGVDKREELKRILRSFVTSQEENQD